MHLVGLAVRTQPHFRCPQIFRFIPLHLPTMDTTLPRTRQVLEDGIAQGLHPGAQLYVSLRGELIADWALGHARPDVPMTTGTLLKWMSTTKPLTAIAIAQLWEQGQLDWDDPVAAHLPAFASHGKQAVTIRHLLTHTAGFPTHPVRWPQASWDEIIADICAAPLLPDWTPGQRAAYHMASSWFILGELVQRRSDQPIDQYLRQHILLPLGMSDCWLAMSPQQCAQYGERFGWLHEMRGQTCRPGEGSVDYPNRCDHPAPGSSGVGPMNQLGKLYEALLAGGEGVLEPTTVALLTSTHRAGMFDETFGRVLDWGLGFIRASNHHADAAEPAPYGYGPHCSPLTFGHGGHQSSNAFADPAHELVVAWCCNGMPGHRRHDRRNHALNQAIYLDLGLASE